MDSRRSSSPSAQSWLSPAMCGAMYWVIRYPGPVLWGALGIALLGILVTVAGMQFKTSRLDLLNPRSEYNLRWLAYLAEFGDQDDVVVAVRGSDAAAVAAAIADLETEVSRNNRPFAYPMSAWDLTSLKSKGLHYLPDHAVAELDRRLQPLRELNFTPETDTLRRLNDALARSETLETSSASETSKRYGESLARIAERADLAWNENEEADFDKLEAAFEPWKRHPLIVEEGRLGFFLLRLKSLSEEFARGSAAIQELRTLLAEVKARHPAVTLGLTGMPILEYDEMQTSQVDMSLVSWLGLFGVCLLFFAGFGGWRYTFFSGITLAIGMAWSFGYLTICVGHLNILSVSFAAILIGLGIDFSIHLVSHYLQFREAGSDVDEALMKTTAIVGPGIFTGGLTTALAFYSAALTQFVGIAELGIISGGGILLCMIASLTALPAMICLADRDRRETSASRSRLLPITTWLKPALSFPSATILATLLVTFVTLGGLPNLRYDHNLLNLQPDHLESVAIERGILSQGDQSFWYAVSIAENAEEARRLKEEFERLSSVSRVEELGSLVPSDVPQTRKSLVRIAAAIEQWEASRPEEFVRELTRAAETCRRVLGPTDRVSQQFEHAVAAADRFPKIAARLALLRDSSDPEPPKMSDLPAPLVKRFVGRTGKFLVRVYAKGHIWDEAALARFTADVEAIDPRVTGHPIQTYYASRHMQRSYMLAAIYSLIAVAAVLMFDFRSIRITLLAMTPLLLGTLQMVGLMGLFEIPFNPANMIALPLILGIGIDDGVHLAHDYLRRGGKRYRLENSTALSVLLTSATTIAGFAVMILARHQGLRSLGQVLTIGVFTCLANSLVFMPALLRLLSWNDSDEEAPPASHDQRTDDTAGEIETTQRVRPRRRDTLSQSAA